jgi:hypothetical protein
MAQTRLAARSPTLLRLYSQHHWKPASLLRRRTQTNATARGQTVAAFEIGSGNLPGVGHGVPLLPTRTQDKLLKPLAAPHHRTRNRVLAVYVLLERGCDECDGQAVSPGHRSR